ncbi:MAG TPA: DUF4268 domain-containing protein [Lysobacter sp.]
MNADTIGRLERVALREVWKHEAYDFTQWLQSNIDVLSGVIDLNLVNVEREQAAGSFSIDLVAEADGGGTVVIENQLERSNHDHLGKLLTYLTAMGARAAVWIVSDPRPEHVAVITWLNESSSADFYMVKAEAVRIGNSAPAPLFTLIVGPTEETREIGQAKKEIAERYDLRKKWWTRLVNMSEARMHAHITPGEYSWIGVRSGIRGLSYNYVVRQDECAAELYIDRGKGCDEENVRIFDQLVSARAAVENDFGGPLFWERMDDKRGCRIRHLYTAGGYRSDEERWPGIQHELVGAMNRLEAALRPHLATVRTG